MTVTKRYYSLWLDVQPEVMDREGVHCSYTPIRDRRLKGYSDQFPLYCWVDGPTVIVSSSPSLEPKVKPIINMMNEASAPAQVEALLAKGFAPLQHARKYVFERQVDTVDTKDVVILKRSDYQAYCDFFRAQYSLSVEPDWLRDYFYSIADRELVFGIFAEDKLASSTTAPDMPFMEGQVQEIGITTLQAYRGRGYARKAVAAMIQQLERKNLVPMWSCSAANVASHALALSVGFRQLADTYYVQGEPK